MISGIKKIEFNSEGFAAILKSDGMQDFVGGIAEGIADRANAGLAEESEGFKAETVHGKKGAYSEGRWLGIVSAQDRAADIAESENKALTKAVR